MTQDFFLEQTFDTFSPKEYLEEYYLELGAEEDNLLKFFLHAYTYIPENVFILEFGGGPTLYQLITAATKAREIYFSDYLKLNLLEVQKWKKSHQKAFNWSTYIERVIQLEGNIPTKELVKIRHDLLRKKITRFILCDAFKKNPLGKKFRSSFDVVSSNFTAESISKNKEEWINTMTNICSLIKSNGFLIMTALKGAKYWHAGAKRFPAANIDEEDIEELLYKLGFKKNTVDLQSFPADTLHQSLEGAQGFKGVLCVVAQKK